MVGYERYLVRSLIKDDCLSCFVLQGPGRNLSGTKTEHTVFTAGSALALSPEAGRGEQCGYQEASAMEGSNGFGGSSAVSLAADSNYQGPVWFTL